MITLAFIVSAAVIAMLIWKVQKIILLYCIGAILFVFGSLSVLLLNFMKDQFDIGWLGNVGIYVLTVGFLALVGGLVRRRAATETKSGRRP